METIAQRLSLLRKPKDKTEFANYLGVKPTYISRYELGKVKPTTEFLTILIEKTGVSLNWLLTGEGDMYISNKPTSQLAKELSELEREVERVNGAILSAAANLENIVHTSKKIDRLKKRK